MDDKLREELLEDIMKKTDMTDRRYNLTNVDLLTIAAACVYLGDKAGRRAKKINIKEMKNELLQIVETYQKMANFYNKTLNVLLEDKNISREKAEEVESIAYEWVKEAYGIEEKISQLKLEKTRVFKDVKNTIGKYIPIENSSEDSLF